MTSAAANCENLAGACVSRLTKRQCHSQIVSLYRMMLDLCDNVAVCTHDRHLSPLSGSLPYLSDATASCDDILIRGELNYKKIRPWSEKVIFLKANKTFDGLEYFFLHLNVILNWTLLFQIQITSNTTSCSGFNALRTL